MQLHLTLSPGRLRGMVSAGAGTALGNASGALLPFLVAAWFVPGPSTDAYFYALGSVLYLGSVVALAVESSTTPYVVHLRASDGSPYAGVRRILWQALAASIAVTVVGCTVVVLFILPRTGFDAAEKVEIDHLLLALMALPPLITVSSVLAGALYAYKQFLLPTFSLALRSVVAIVFGMVFRDRFGMLSIIAGLIIGEFLRFVLLRRALRRHTAVSDASSRHDAKGPGFWLVAGPQIASMSLAGLSPMVDKTVATKAGIGAVTTLELAQRLAYTPTLLLASAVGLVVGAAWAQTLTQPDGDRLARRDFWRTQRMMLGASVGAAVLCCAVVWTALPLLAELLHISDPVTLATLFTVLATAMPIMLFTNLCVRLLIAARRTKVMPSLTAVTVTLNLVLDLLFLGWFGLVGIAVASLAVAIVNAGMYFWVIQRTRLEPVDTSSDSLTSRSRIEF